MPLIELIHTDIISLPPTATLLEAAALMRRQRIGSVFIKSAGTYVGIVTEADLVRKGISKSLTSDTLVEKLMTSPIIEIDVQRSVIEANHFMHFNAIRHLGISKEGKIIGMISVRDLVQYFSRQPNGPAQALNDVYQPLSVLVQREIVSLPLHSTVQEGASLMGQKKIGSLLVVEGDKNYIGVVTESDLVRKVIGLGLDPAQIPVGAVMNVPILDIDINRSVNDANLMMASRGVRHLAVSEQGRIIGVLSIRDLIAILSVRDLPRFLSEKKKG